MGPAGPGCLDEIRIQRDAVLNEGAAVGKRIRVIDDIENTVLIQMGREGEGPALQRPFSRGQKGAVVH